MSEHNTMDNLTGQRPYPRPGLIEYLALLCAFGIVKSLFLGNPLAGTALAELQRGYGEILTNVYSITLFLIQFAATFFPRRVPRVVARTGWLLAFFSWATLAFLNWRLVPQTGIPELAMTSMFLQLAAYFRRGRYA